MTIFALTFFNANFYRLLSASFDGTAKIWPWNSANFDSNKNMKPIFIFEGDLGKVTKYSLSKTLYF